MSLDGTRLVRTRTGDWRLVRENGSVVWESGPAFGYDDDFGAADTGLTTAAGARQAADLVGQMFYGGDWKMAGQQAFSQIQRVSGQKNAGDQLATAAEAAAPAATMAIIMAACIAAGSSFFGIGAVVGAVVGAITCFVMAMVGMHHEPSSQDELNGANSIQDNYEQPTQGGAAWFKPNTPGGLTGRDNFFSVVPAHYAASITDGMTPWDIVLSGSESNGGDRPLIAIDYALWCATKPDGLKALMQKGTDPGLQAKIFPLMPMSFATIVYMCYVPVLAAPGCYSPAAIQAVRQAANAQVAPAGNLVAQCMAISLPPDDVQLLLYAFHFIYYEGDAGDPRTSHRPESPLNYLTARDGLWGPTSPMIPELATIIGQAAFAKTRDAQKAKALIKQLSTSIEGMARLDVGKSLGPNGSLSSPNGKYKLALQGDGNLVLYAGSAVRWASGTSGKGANKLTVQSDGNVVLYAGNAPVWATNTNGRGGGGTFLGLQNDGNLVAYASPGAPIWASNTPDGGTVAGGIELATGGLQKLFAAVDTASTKPVVTDCLLGQTAIQIDMKIGLPKAVEQAQMSNVATAVYASALMKNLTPAQQAFAAAAYNKALAGGATTDEANEDAAKAVAAMSFIPTTLKQTKVADARAAAAQAKAAAAAAAAQQHAALAMKAKAGQAAIVKAPATKSLVKKIALGGAGALAFVGLIKLSLPKNPRPF